MDMIFFFLFYDLAYQGNDMNMHLKEMTLLQHVASFELLNKSILGDGKFRTLIGLLQQLPTDRLSNQKHCYM